MDINEAALRLKKIEVIQGQIAHLQYEAKKESSTELPDYDYCIDCNKKAQELCETLKEFWL